MQEMTSTCTQLQRTLCPYVRKMITLFPSFHDCFHTLPQQCISPQQALQTTPYFADLSLITVPDLNASFLIKCLQDTGLVIN